MTSMQPQQRAGPWLTEITPDVLEAVANELAHVRRLVLWVNLLQRLMETPLFYQPSVWWLGGQRPRATRPV